MGHMYIETAYIKIFFYHLSEIPKNVLTDEEHVETVKNKYKR